MKTITIAAQKGGAGKTTLTLGLAWQAINAGKRVVIYDLDPQESATVWGEAREEMGKEDMVIIPSSERRLQRDLDNAAENGADFVFIDTPPHAESTILAAARAADLVLIPVRPGGHDLDALPKTVNALELAKANAAFVANGWPHQRRMAVPGFKAHLEDNFPPFCLAPVTIFDRAAIGDTGIYRTTAQERQPDSMAAKEMQALWLWASRQVS